MLTMLCFPTTNNISNSNSNSTFESTYRDYLHVLTHQTNCNSTRNSMLQRVNMLISAAIDEHERRYGLVSNRGEFENLEVELPLRLRGIFNERSTRMLPRNTFIDMQQLPRSRSSLLMLGGGGGSGGMRNFRGSAPDLSRSVPSTPIMHKQQRAQMRSELVLAEDEEEEHLQQLKRASVATMPSSRSQLRLITKQPEPIPQPTPNELVKVVTTTPLLNSAEELNAKPAMSTFRQTTPPVVKTPEDLGLVTNRFARLDVNEPPVELRIHEGPVLSAHTQRLLHSTSFAIKRPSLASRSSGRSSLSSAQSMYNMHEMSTSTRYCSDAEIVFDAGRKAAALLDEVQPQLRSTLKPNGVNGNGHVAATDDFYCDLYAAKYKLPRINQRQLSLDEDTSAG